MNERIQNAAEIAKAYRLEHSGQIPALVIAHGATETFTIVGRFRSDERGGGAKTLADQKQFVSLMRIAFAMRGVTSYEVITKPEVANKELQLTQNLLGIFAVDKKGTSGKFYEIDEEELIPVYDNLKMGSWFSKLLPTNFNVELDAKTQARINKYITACTYNPPAPKSSSIEDAFETMMKSL